MNLGICWICWSRRDATRWMINWILFQYHSGCRPGETRLIKLRDCEIERLEDGKVKGIIKIPLNTKNWQEVYDYEWIYPSEGDFTFGKGR